MASEETLIEQASRTSGEIERKDTGVRILLSLLFVVISEIVKSILALVILFELLYALITKRAPSDGVRRFGHRVVVYGYQIAEYLTYNRDRPPFPLGELTQEEEPGTAS